MSALNEQEEFEFRLRAEREGQAAQQVQPKFDEADALRKQIESEPVWKQKLLAAGSGLVKTALGAKQLFSPLTEEQQGAVQAATAAEEISPFTAAAGNIATMVAPGLGAAGLAAKAPMLARAFPSTTRAAEAIGSSLMAPKTLGKAAAGGAGYMALQPNVGAESDMVERAVGSVKGALLGSAGYGAAKGLGRILSPKLASSAVDDNYLRQVQLLEKEGIPTTIGQKIGGTSRVTESKLTSTPAVGDLIGWRQSQGIDKLNLAAYQRALAPIGEKPSGKIGFEGVEEVHSKLSNAYQDLAGKMNFKPDAQFGSDLQNIRTMVDELTEQYAGLYDKLINRIVTSRATPQGNMSGETLKSVESSLGKEISLLRSKGGYEHTKIADALESTQSSIRENLARQNPEWAKKLQKVNEGWSNYAIIRDATSTATGRKGGAFTPANLASAVSANVKRQAGQTVGKARISEGRANMQDLSSAAENVLAQAYPDSGTAGRTLPWLGAMAAGGTGMATGTAPFMAGAAGLAAIPYLPIGSQLANLAMTKRPDIAIRAGSRLSDLAPYAAPLAVGYGQ